MKFSIVTPSYNSVKYISETIESVISQKGDFEIEYIIMDSCSTDNTIDIVRRYQRKIIDGSLDIKCKGISILFESKKDKGMYDAINKGFAKATGDIFAWINADDIYLPGAFSIVEKAFQEFSEIKWLKGITSYINEASVLFRVGKCFLYDREWIKRGVYGREAYFIQQDSVFWRSDLWRSAGGIDDNLKLAGDYYLWARFAENAPLFSLRAYLSCFRRAKGQLSENFDSYEKEYEKITVAPSNHFLKKRVEFFFKHIQRFPKFLQKPFYRLFFGRQNLYLIDLTEGLIPVLRSESFYAVD